MKTMSQTNLAAIMTTVGGVNIPYSNIGFFVPELIVFKNESEQNLKELVLIEMLNEK